MMSPPYRKLRAVYALILKLWRALNRVPVPVNRRDFEQACKDLAFWSVSDASLSGPIEAFDGSALHRAADGLYTIRMTLRDSIDNRAPADAAKLVLRSLEGIRILLLLEIDGRRFVQIAPNVNVGVRDLCEVFTSRRESAG